MGHTVVMTASESPDMASPTPMARTSWFPLAIEMLCQIQVSFNAFNVSIEGIVKDLGIPPTSVGLVLTTSPFAMAVLDRHHLRVGCIQRPQRLGLLHGSRPGAVRHFRSVSRAVLARRVALVPYTLSIFVANTQVSRPYACFSPTAITRASFAAVSLALTLLPSTIRNDWRQVAVVIGLVTRVLTPSPKPRPMVVRRRKLSIHLSTYCALQLTSNETRRGED